MILCCIHLLKTKRINEYILCTYYYFYVKDTEIKYTDKLTILCKKMMGDKYVS